MTGVMIGTTTGPPGERADGRVPRRPVLLAAALGTVYVAWGSTYLAVRVMVDDMPALLGSGTRALAAAGLLAVALVAWGGWRRLRVTRAQLAGCAVVGVLLPVGGQGLVTVAEDGGAASGLTALLVAAVPLWVLCLRAGSGDRPRARSVVGVVLGFAGVAWLLVGARGTGAGPTSALLLVVAASMSWALGTWLQPRLGLPANAFTVVVYEMLVGGTVLSLLGLSRGERFVPGSYPVQAWTAWTFLVVVGSVLALTAYNWLLQSTSVSVVSTYAYVNPAIAVVLGGLVLGEAVTAATLLSAGVIVAGVALVVTAERRKDRS
jgi:drug/metabolite transporter (DMT)-like permease